jgi:hypothetical protein
MALVEPELLRLRGRTKFASTPPREARKLLSHDGTAAVALMLATRHLIGDFHDWEPETLWLSLERDGIDVPLCNRDKLQAGIALLFVPSFYWDGIVFEKTAIAFDCFESNPDALEEASSAQLAWAVKEASWILAQHQPFGGVPHAFAHEPTAYSALVMHREGLVQAPKQLAFAQGALDRLNTTSDLRTRVKERWDSLDKVNLADMNFEETEEDVQLARLAAIELHILDKEKNAAANLALLR